MGNKTSKSSSKKEKKDEIRTFLTNSYKNTNASFDMSDLITYKLRIKDAEQYFKTKFNYFLVFNNNLFKDCLNILYDNFSQTLEKNLIEYFNIFVYFDNNNNSRYFNEENLELDSLFTIIFEKLEIITTIFFDFSPMKTEFLKIFFEQLIESIELYKYIRKFDNFYILLSNLDFLVKFEFSLIYFSNKEKFSMKMLIDDSFVDFRNEFINTLGKLKDKDKLLNCRYFLNNKEYFEKFVEETKPSLAKIFLDLNELEEIHENNENNEPFKFLGKILDQSECIVFVLEKINSKNEIVRENLRKFILFLLNKFVENLTKQQTIGVKIFSNNFNNNNNINQNESENEEEKEKEKEEENEDSKNLQMFEEIFENYFFDFIPKINKIRKFSLDYEMKTTTSKEDLDLNQPEQKTHRNQTPKTIHNTFTIQFYSKPFYLYFFTKMSSKYILPKNFQIFISTMIQFINSDILYSNIETTIESN